ncbi:amino acid ABC transporter permease [Brucella intermedia]|uniref:amino acid ABC transporter permease n=1 Tax=Brucella intermedia TaxID=94625 RepID=UPI0022495277|nr:amino acid ABC transporter permease [Brucella intermedia]
MKLVNGQAERKKRNRTTRLNDPQMRGYIYQLLTLAVVVLLLWYVWNNIVHNLARTNMSVGFEFLHGRAGFEIAQSLIAYTSDSSYRQALYVGLTNTLIVATAGIVTATILGVLLGVGRLSHNWIVSRLCTAYIELFRNIPPLLLIFFWYLGVLSLLPSIRMVVKSTNIDSDALLFVTNRGFYIPKPVVDNGFEWTTAAFFIGLLILIAASMWNNRRQRKTGRRMDILLPGIVAIICLSAFVFFMAGMPLRFDYPIPSAFNIKGGAVISPEFFSLYLGLSLYTASFIAEVVRAGIRGVPNGQSEAAQALGLTASQTVRLIVLPQALRIVIPPLTSQYLNLIKNSSLAVAVGYADVVAVGGTILNQTGRSIEIIAIWMLIYLSISLGTSLFMNWFNTKMAFVER